MGNIRYKGSNYTKDTRASYVQVEPLSVTENGTYTAESGKAYNPVSVNVEPPKSNDVTFYDYDGTVVYSYSAADFAELTEMPANPTHTGLTSQGWNWSLSDAKSYVADYGKLNIGQMYITDDGKTRLVIQLEDGRLSPTLRLGLNGTATIDWGDGSATTTMTGLNTSTTVYSTHDYAGAGEYTILISIEGDARIFGDSSVGTYLIQPDGSYLRFVYYNSLYRVFIGSNMDIGECAFSNCTALVSVTIPSGVNAIGNFAFDNCFSLVSITIPIGVSRINNSMLATCCSLINVAIPNSVNFIDNSAFKGCRALTGVTIPENVTTISTNAFSNCTALVNVIISEGVRYIESSAFIGCSSISNVVLPNSTQNIGSSSFSGCSSVSSVIIHGNSLVIGNSAFVNCRSIANITIPDSTNSVGVNAFQNCYGLGYIKFESTTPPTIYSTNWSSLQTDCKILVPQGTLETYKVAQNYPDPNTYTYEEYTE